MKYLTVLAECVLCCSDESSRLDEQRKFLDQEIEKVLEQREKMEQLEKVRAVNVLKYRNSIRSERLG
jgi:hypothetical protein